jgi:adenylate kinase
MNRLLIVGPPGAGKGTQAAQVSEALSIPIISTGDLFREHARAGSELGKRVAAIMAAGEYVPDDITNAMVEQRLREGDTIDGFILDGYPRTVDQVEVLDGLLAESGAQLDSVVHIDADPEQLVARLLERAQSQGRADDTEDVIRRRIEIYLELTAPVLEVYQSRGIVITVDGLPPADEVTAEILERLRSSTTAA